MIWRGSPERLENRKQGRRTTTHVENILWGGIDWGSMLVPTKPILESFLRISIVYLFLVGLFRLILKRESADIYITDLLVLVLIADAVQNAMADDYQSVPDGLVLASTLIFWNWFLSYASMRWRRVRRVLLPAPLLLVRNGEMIKANMRKEHLTPEELMSQLRLQGVERLEDVKYVFMEMDGRISAIKKEGDQDQRQEPRRGI
ncbi:MAG: DUF421 domain-containing protein [Chloroflexota bacterium]|nr:MAG: DUF421 domain-containing protein [Chloroflexota bacterium]